VDKGVLKEGLVSTGSKNPIENDPLDPDIITRLDNCYRYEPISPNYYSNEEAIDIIIFETCA
jgi:hypothetical protein